MEPHRARCVAVSLGVLVLLFASGVSLEAQSSTPIAGFYETDCTTDVYALSVANGVLYAGGNFSYVGPQTGHLAELDTGTGALAPGFPQVDGVVYSVVSDGTGGWYVGGLFTRVGSFPRANIAHILPNHEVSAWNPGANDRVDAILPVGRSIYVGGLFTTAGGQSRNRIAAIDAATGMATAWNPGADGWVAALAYDAGVLYVGGSFVTIAGQPRNRIAALDPATGAALAWDPNAGSTVRVIRVAGSRIYVGGSFTTIGGAARQRIAALDTASGSAVAGWDPGADDNVVSLALSADTLYVGGIFLHLGGQARTQLGAVDLSTGVVTSWIANSSGIVYSLSLANGLLWVGGGFTVIGTPGQNRNYIAALDPATGAVASWRSDADGTVTALAVEGTTLCAGGLFESIAGQRRSNLAAIDTATGTLSAWDPRPSNQVWSLHATTDAVYAGGYFGAIGGVTRSMIAAIDPTSGAATSWNPVANQLVRALAVSGGQVYAAGDFTTIGGQGRSRVAALDVVTGQATSWNPNANGSVGSLVPITGGVLLGGGFTTVGGQTRNYIAAVDDSTGLAMAWNPNANDTVSSLTLTPDGSLVYAAGLFTTIGGQSRNRLAALDASTGQATAWNPNADSGARGVVLDGSNVVLAGTFLNVSGQARARLASVSTGGLLSAWNPNVDPTYPSALVFSAVRSGRTLYVGGRFRQIGGSTRCNIAAFCLWNAPTGLVVTATGLNSVSLSWTGVGAPTYAVYRSRTSGGGYERVGSSATTSFVDLEAHALAGGNRYYYVVKAADECESDPSNEVSAQPTGSCTLGPDFEGLAWAEQQGGATCSVGLGWMPASAPCGGGVTYSVYRSDQPGFEASSANRLASGVATTAYTDSSALESGRRYYYVVRAASVLSGQQDWNERRQSASAQSCTAGAPLPVTALTVRSTPGENRLEWVNPPAGYGETVIRFRTDTYPTSPSDGDGVPVGAGVAGAPQWTLHTDVVAGQTYYYAAFVGDGSGGWSAAARASAFWPGVAPPVGWAFSTGVSALGTTRVLPGEAYYSVTNDGFLHSLVSGTGSFAGEWRSGWTPFGMNGASQQRPVVLRLQTFTVAGASGVAFVASQDGHVYAVNADTGAQLWRTEKLAEAFQAAPSVVLQEQGASYDLVIVATRNTVGRNEIIALRPGDGSVAWTFDNGGGASAFGIVSAKPTIDVARDRVYFTTRRNAAGTSHTLWCLTFTADAAAYLWSDAAAGDIDSAAIVSGSTVYVGGNDGVVHAYGVDGGPAWSHDTGAGQPVKGFVQPFQGNLYFSAGGGVYALTQSGAPVAGWAVNPVSIAGSSPPLVTPTRIYVGGANSRLYSIDIATGAISSSVELGDPSKLKAVGAPTMDNRAGQIVVGAEDGVVYLVPAF